jgi:hypothetical protein
MQNMQKKTKICEVCLQKRNMQNMQKYSKYEEYDLHADFAGEELVNGRRSPDVELWVNCVEHRTNNFVPHVVKPPAIDWLVGPNIVPAQAAVTHSGRASLCSQGSTHLGCPLPASRSNIFLPLAIGGRAPSARRMCAMA